MTPRVITTNTNNNVNKYATVKNNKKDDHQETTNT